MEISIIGGHVTILGYIIDNTNIAGKLALKMWFLVLPIYQWKLPMGVDMQTSR